MSELNISSLPTSLQLLIDQLDQKRPKKPSQLRKLLLESSVTEDDLEPWKHFDHSSSDSYGRKMVYDGGQFEIMVMSWNPGDISAIHDHGYTQWGAVKVFGAAEHAAFIIRDGAIRTLNRTMFKPGQVVGVGHDMVHQMGCPIEGEGFVSLHIYGNHERNHDITADTRLYELSKDRLSIISGGAFFNCPEACISEKLEAPEYDFATVLRDRVETIRLNLRSGKREEALIEKTFAKTSIAHLNEDLENVIDEQGHHCDSNYWQHLSWELKEAAHLQQELFKTQDDEGDSFDTYAALYDAVIGKPCLENFMSKYLHFFVKEFKVDLSAKTMLSVGCGTGLVEEFMLKDLQLERNQLLGIDLSPAMVEVASKRIHAEVGNALELDPNIQTWDIAYSGLNVLQYIGHENMEEVVRRVSSILNPGGYFLGDFITPDHIRWYPNVLWSKDKNIVSLRLPSLVEHNQHTYQRSHIINVDASGNYLRITDEGKHDRFLPPLNRVRAYFEAVFEDVQLFDAIHLTPIGRNADTCPSTRYIVVAKK